MKYDKVAQHLIHGIRIGLYPDQSKIPSEKEIAEKLGVSLTSVRKGLQILCEKNIITKQQGMRSVVNASALQAGHRTLHFAWVGRDTQISSTPVLFEIYSRVVNLFMQSNCHITFLPFHSTRDEAMLLRMFDSFDGFLLASIQPHLLSPELQEKIQLLNSVIEIDDIGVSSARWKICTDNYLAGLQISEYLAEQKRKRPVIFLSDFADAYPGFSNRNRGLIDGLSAHQIPFVLVPGGEHDLHSSGFADQIANLLKKYPDIDTVWHPEDAVSLAIRKVFEKVAPRAAGHYRSCGVDGLPDEIKSDKFHASASHDLDEIARVSVETMLNFFAGQNPASAQTRITTILSPWK